MDGVLEAGAIEQVVPVNAGDHYRLTFQMSGNNDCGGNAKRMRVQLGPSSQEVQFDCAPVGPQVWVTKTIEFDAASSLVAVRFVSLSGAGCGPLLDDVQLLRVIPCPGDVVQNGFVDGADLAAVLAVWGTNGGIYPRADVNGDGIVNGSDLAAVLGAWGACG